MAELSEEELIELAPEGCDVTPPKLKRWRRVGVMPRPRQIHPAGRRGSESLYPPWAGRQLLALCRLHRRERRLEDLKFWLWWEGHWVEREALRATLASLFTETLTALPGRRSRRQTHFTAAQEFAEKALAEKRSPLIRLLRYRLRGNPEDLTSALFLLMLAILGGDIPWGAQAGLEDLDESSAEELLARGLGLEQAREGHEESRLLEDPVDVPHVVATLKRAGILPVKRLARVAREATDEELTSAKDDARFLAEDMEAIATAAEAVWGRDILGLGIFRVHGRSARGQVERRVLFVPAMIALRRSLPEDQLKNWEEVKVAFRKEWLPAAGEFLEWRKERRPRRRSGQ